MDPLMRKDACHVICVGGSVKKEKNQNNNLHSLKGTATVKYQSVTQSK